MRSGFFDDDPTGLTFSITSLIPEPISVELYSLAEGEEIPDNARLLGMVGESVIEDVLFEVELF